MSQQTTKEFSARLRMAVDGHPQAPDNPYGRQAWLREKLVREAKIEVSPNAVHKWMNDAAKPREDNIRAIAKVLNVDELWLSMGKTPGGKADSQTADPGVATAKAGALVLAGLIEMKGGRVLLPGGNDPAHIRCSLGGRDQGIVVVTPEAQGTTYTAIVPEPVGDLRLAAVFTQCEPDDGTVCLDIVDLTDAPRQHFGGYSVLQLERRSHGKFKIEGVRNLLSRVESVEDLVA